MKKTLAIFISLCMVLSLAACGSSAGKAEQPSAGESFVDHTADQDVQADGGGTDAIEDTNVPEAQAGEAESLESEQEEAEGSDAQQSKVVVAYFSATNTTEGVAEHIANGLGADLYEIVPKEPYTDADLDYNDNDSRTTIEMNDPNARPEISGSVENMDQYNIVFIG